MYIYIYNYINIYCTLYIYIHMYLYIYIIIYTYSICIPIIHRTIMGYIRNSDCFLLRKLPSNSLGVAGGVRANGSFTGREFTGLSTVIIEQEASWLGDWKYSWGDLEKASTWSSTSTSLCGKKCGSVRAIWFIKGTVPTGWRICRTLRRFQIYQNTLDIPYPILWIS